MPTAHGLPLPPSGVTIDGSEVLWMDKEIGGEWFTYQFTAAELIAIAGGGTVSSVGLSLPAMFNVSGSPVTTTGTLTAALANQSANRIFAGPASGAVAAPTFRVLVWDDIPTISSLSGVSNLSGTDLVAVELSAGGNRVQATISQLASTVGGGTVTSVALSLPGMFNVSGSPVTTAGTLTAALANQSANTFFVGPTSGAAVAPTFRLIAWNNDLPLYSTVSSTSGLDGDEHILVEKGSTFLQTTTRFIAQQLLNLINVFTKNQSVQPVEITTSGTYTPDASVTNNWQITISGNITLANPTNLTKGMMLNFCLDENGTGGFSITLGNLFKFGSGTVPTWVTTSNAKNFLSGYYDGTVIRCGAAVGLA